MKRLELRVNDVMYEEMLEAAAKYNLPVATWCRLILIDALAEIRVRKEGEK